MSDDLKPKMEVPNRLGLAVLVCEVQTGGKLIPLTRYEQPDGEGLRISHGAHKAVLGLDVLREATLLCLHTCGLPAETVRSGYLRTAEDAVPEVPETVTNVPAGAPVVVIEQQEGGGL